MNTQDILRYGHETVLASVEGLEEKDWYTPGVCGDWSVKDIIAHLTSFEHVLVDVLTSLLETGPTPTLDRFIEAYEQFNDVEVEARRDMSAHEVLIEYRETYAQAAERLTQVPAEMYGQNGILAWYGDEYDLDDFIVFTFYGHKREHCAQIGVFG